MLKSRVNNYSTQQRTTNTNRHCRAVVTLIALLTVLLLMSSLATAQIITASLSGTVYDQSGAVVPKADVTLKNQASGDERRIQSNGEGYFSFAAVPPGTYTVSITSQGFSNWSVTGVVLNAGDSRAVTGVKLAPGGKSENIVVEAADMPITPIDSGEKSTLITEKIMQNVAIVGQNAAEFIKIMPGMAMTGGMLNTTSYAAADERTGNGPVGSFSANGTRTAALDITSDGAHIIDPGCNCGQSENTNVDMTAEVKVMTSNFGADVSKGPVLISAIGKSGGQQFHGEGYIYIRDHVTDANDWLNNHAVNSLTGQHLSRPETRYLYPGFNIGGPVVIPGTGINKSRQKLFFFAGTEFYRQNVDNGIYKAVVPTMAMRNGDFTDSAYISKLQGYAVSGVPNSNGFVNGMLQPTVNAADVANGQRLMNTYPLPNADPALNGGNNFVQSSVRYSNMYQIRGRVDYNISDNTKLYVTYNAQRDNAQESLDTLWTGNAQSWASPTVPYPSPLVESTQSDVVSASLTKVFSPTLTNELVFSYTFLNLPNSFADPSKVTRSGLGLNYGLIFNHTNPGGNGALIFPQMSGWGDGIANQLNAGFELNGVVFAKKTLPSVQDNLSKVWGTHTAKFGFYWERTWNSQPGNGTVNGSLSFANWGGTSTGNAYADMLVGNYAGYGEQNFDTVPAFRYMTTEFYGMDSWKINRRFTLDYGLRVSHLGPWVDTTGYGFAIWDPSKYVASNDPNVWQQYTGFDWHKRNSAVPLSGAPARLFFYEPRAGFAWDLFGSGRTVLRGGYGLYRYHDEQNVQNPAYGVTQGSYSQSLSAGTGYSSIAASAGTVPQPGNLAALQMGDTQQPRTQSYSLTVAERMPLNSTLEVGYVGSKSDYLSDYNNHLYDLNLLPVGALFASTGKWENSYSSSDQQAARPYQNYAVANGGGIKIINHQMYSNYNSLQVTWNKQAGRLTFMANYTFSKSLGIRGENGAATGDIKNIQNDYGTLPNNRTNIFNLAYVYQFPKTSSSNAVAKTLLNNWQVSGIVQHQSGSDLQAAVTSNFNYSAYIDPAVTSFMGTPIPAGTQASNQNTLGTADVTLLPKVICNPGQGLHLNQFVNGNCFASFTEPGQQGTYIIPTVTGPGFFNTDLSLFKDIPFGKSETKKLTFRVSGYNFLNHPNRTFISNDPGLNLNFNQAGQLVPNAPNSPFGYALNKTGHRIMQFVVKFSF